MPMARPEVSEVVKEKVRAAFKEKAEDILASLQWDGLCGCWLFQFAGMTVGVELDGYIHS